jgi:predicted DNA-binding protein
MQTIATRLPDKTRTLLEDMAQAHNKTVSEFLRDLVEDYLDEQIDLKLMEEYSDWQKDNPDAKTYTLDEVKEAWGV